MTTTEAATRTLRSGLPVVALSVVAGLLFVSRPGLALLAVGAFAVIVVLLTAPGLLLVLAIPATFAYYRVGPDAVDLSLADVALALALAAAVPFVPWRAPVLRKALAVLAAYLLVLAIPVVAVPSSRAFVEWGHRAFLVGGCLIVGATIAATGRTRRALLAFVATAAVVATAAIIEALTHWDPETSLPEPAYPLGIHKNAAGFLLAGAVIVVLVARPYLRLPTPARALVLPLVFGGVVACQSRGAAVMLVVVLAVWAVRERKLRLSLPVVLGLVLLVGVTYVSTSALYTGTEADSRFNSANSRVETYDAALELWRGDPLVGVGLKFWRDPLLQGAIGFGEPHNLVVSALAESGVVGLVGLVVLVGGLLLVLRRAPAQTAGLAFLVLLAQAVDSMLGIFWVAGTLTFAWLVVGTACAVDPTLPAPTPQVRRATPDDVLDLTRQGA